MPKYFFLYSDNFEFFGKEKDLFGKEQIYYSPEMSIMDVYRRP